MTSQEYLSNLGYSDDFTVLSKKEVEFYKDKEGAINNIYGVNDPRGKKEFGQGAKIVKKAWMARFPKPEETEEQAAAEIPVPPAEAVPVPPAPPVDNTPVIEQVEEPMPKGGSKSFIKEDNDLPGDNAKEPIVEDAEELFQYCTQNMQTGQYCDEQCEFCKGQESKTETEEVATTQEDVTYEDTAHRAVLEEQERLAEEEIRKEQEQKMQEAKAKSKLDEAVEEQRKKDLAAAKEAALKKAKEQQEPVKEVKPEKVEPPKTKDVPEVKEEQQVVKQVPVVTEAPTKFFEELSKLAFQQINLTITKFDEKLVVVIKPQNFSGDSAFDSIPPRTLKATAKELDKHFIDAIIEPLEVVSEAMTDADDFLKSVEKAKKETEAFKKKKEKVKKAKDAADKVLKDMGDKVDLDKAVAAYNKVLDIDKSNKEVKKVIENLRVKYGQKSLL